MKVQKIAIAGIAVFTLLVSAGQSVAQDAISAPATKTIGVAKTEMVPSLIVLNSRGATLDGSTLTLTGVAPNAIIFADRPVRAAGHALTTHLLEEWNDGNDSFGKDPPNATVSVLNNDATGVTDAVVVLTEPKLAGDTVTFNVEVLEGSLSGDGPAAIFIDIIGRPLTPLSYAGFARRAAYRGAWYGAAAAGAAAVAAPYYHPYAYPPPPCGYYPYPPCY
jgi:hypothetical protein